MEPLLAVSDVLWLIVVGMLAFIFKEFRDAQRATWAANLADDVKTNLTLIDAAREKKLDEMIQVVRDTHTLVNSAMGAQLRLHAITARAKADITKDRADIVAAETAERMLDHHNRQQAKVDAVTPESES
jgi:hypothetical protein